MIIILLVLHLIYLCHIVCGTETFTLDTSPPQYAGGMVPGAGHAAGGWMPGLKEYPWAVGVHKRNDDGIFEHLCGGSLITTQVVVTAAHCFWTEEGDVPLEDYTISVGNFRRALDRDYQSQQVEIEKIVFHERYRGVDLNYAYDIAVALLKNEVNLTDFVTPIAIDWRSEFEDTSLGQKTGVVVGWGLTELDEPSESRVAVGLPFVDFAECYKVVPREFRKSLTPDKFCAGLRNGTAVCPGDSGGGLAFRNIEDNNWYLRGIVSVGVRTKGVPRCHKSQYSAFTSISQYRSWLQQKLMELKSSNSDTVPHNQYTTEDVSTHIVTELHEQYTTEPNDTFLIS